MMLKCFLKFGQSLKTCCSSVLYTVAAATSDASNCPVGVMTTTTVSLSRSQGC
ncbi:hypothetical protein PF005_g17980 [Phytophthora fragariae]|uniref:Uncharacterized protein n=1 Tax=Phytophthora fragariae TaxID=53985 RepID=A0A6A3X274_9STRA|nr:hypothetical protein PF003_g34250 [Phytophthora fragariae]KAE8930864.1 hypothetical protein PF009_g19058 [Phytophthora fragariae]KAE8994126.1 hypothetical protein PF011_g16845 [Phytophthora fragariae]KAE9077353.1 hypothetical protein PF010_g23544 [Phytophthora fragariae]KAE9093711.1 hypothetical protein PF007_g18026 [Phytophthora fragariae]